MKARLFAAAVILAGVGVGAGVLLDRHLLGGLHPTTPATGPSARAVIAPPRPSMVPPVSHTDPASEPAVADILAALQTALNQPDDALRFQALLELTWKVPVPTIREMLDTAKALGKPKLTSRFFNESLSRWAETDPQAALAYAQNMEGMPYQRNQIGRATV